jgi:hypothetical protein
MLPKLTFVANIYHMLIVTSKGYCIKLTQEVKSTVYQWSQIELVDRQISSKNVNSISKYFCFYRAQSWSWAFVTPICPSSVGQCVLITFFQTTFPVKPQGQIWWNIPRMILAWSSTKIIKWFCSERLNGHLDRLL